ncbi:serine/threonine protein kinase [Polyangium jinanense]|uniref:Serine/threonine protein kinase n=1 Tax=Polyangium jinanense TaxID=2829994 RepID=A0A9X4APQ4_9BACT|nr:serine/threonine-protein kinase [Polyangium jinanense]MDC3952680.1 serine/threonine protein kinase [Polyangium jinanense]MDC3980299.1 serine/threonine protein kinase [Polyangium jinanense]
MAEPDAGLLAPGKIFHGHYEVVRCVSTGAMGAVYEVIDQKTLRRRALKVMLPGLVGSPEMRERFKLEATVTADIVSEHIVETFDADVDQATGAPFLVMELLRGDDLANVLGDRGKLSPPEIVLVLSQAARALDKTHAAGIVHRDLKPENIFITYRDDGTPRIKLLDFGIAKVLASGQHGGIKQQTINLGTPPYMSPEQILGEGTIDHRADLYALAHIAYALLVGEPYWLEDSRKLESLYTLLLHIVEGAKEPASVRARRYGVELPQAFDAWFVRATWPKPDGRFAKASDLVLALAQVLGVPLDARPMTSTGDWDLTATGTRKLAGGLYRPPVPGAPSSSPVMPAPVPPLPPAPALRPPGAAPYGPYSRAAMASPDAPPAKKSNRKAIGAVLLVAFVVGIGVAAIVLRLSAPVTATAAGGVAATVAPTVAAATPEARAPSSAATVEAPPAATTASPAPSSASAITPAAATTGKSVSPTPTTKTNPTPKAGTTKQQTGYDPLREL